MDAFDKQFSDLEPSAPAPDRPDAPPKPDAAPPADKAPPKPDKPADAPPEAPAKPVDGEDAPRSGTFTQMRQWGIRQAERAKAEAARVKELSSKIIELEQRAPQMPPDVEKIQADYQRLQKENAEHRERLARADYSQSPEYEEKFKAPYQQAYLRGRSIVTNLQVRELNAETGETSTRPGTQDDFDRLYAMTDSDADSARPSTVQADNECSTVERCE